MDESVFVESQEGKENRKMSPTTKKKEGKSRGKRQQKSFWGGGTRRESRRPPLTRCLRLAGSVSLRPSQREVHITPPRRTAPTRSHSFPGNGDLGIVFSLSLGYLRYIGIVVAEHCACVSPKGSSPKASRARASCSVLRDFPTLFDGRLGL